MKIRIVLLIASVLLILSGLAFASCPDSVTCPEDGATMVQDGQQRMVAGHMEREYFHMGWDQKTQTAVRHTLWVMCD